MPAPSLNFTKRRSAPVGKLFLLSFASIALLALDQRFEGVQQIRKVAASLTFPLQWLASQPVELYRYTRSLAQSQTALQAQNRQLNAENIRLQATANQNRALEKELMEQKMAQLQTKRIGAYLRKMAIDGYIIQVDTRDIKEMNKLLSAIGRNINQIAKRVNAGGPTYQADMEEIRERLDQIWQLQRRILLSQR